MAEHTRKPWWKSRKLILGAVGVLLTVAKVAFDLDIDVPTMVAALTPIVAVILGIAVEDAKTNSAKIEAAGKVEAAKITRTNMDELSELLKQGRENYRRP